MVFRKRAFTLIEVISLFIIVTMVMGVLYKIFSGTWMNFFKTQTKLTNLRSACLLLEYLKHDIRLSDRTGDYKLATQPWDFNFSIRDSKGNLKKVIYDFDGKVIKRNEGGGAKIISQAKVAKFDMATTAIGSQTCLNIIIEVDAEKGEVAEANRTNSSKGNKMTLSASLFPPFLQKSSMDKEEEYWYNARK
ncbi:MAG: hypothetical protein HQM10_05345 [Candidatus Riflebacteria bacterium]|nr:hypothetical protein [Candidatus Riflebacteria bacterium]